MVLFYLKECRKLQGKNSERFKSDKEYKFKLAERCEGSYDVLWVIQIN